jgi:hypothetical protein
MTNPRQSKNSILRAGEPVFVQLQSLFAINFLGDTSSRKGDDSCRPGNQGGLRR